MRALTLIKLGAIAALSLLAGCASGTLPAPKPMLPQPGIKSWIGGPSRAAGFDNCPATGPLKYTTNLYNGAINIYAGKFTGQPPCGQISAGINLPYGIYVKNSTHDLYVANINGHDVVVFHRGQTSPYNVYTDPTGQDVADVTVAGDGTVIASNFWLASGVQQPSISTWIGGPNGGTFVGNFPMPNAQIGLYVTVRKNGAIYFDDSEVTGIHAIWSLTCPAGACGTPTRVSTSATRPFGLACDNSGDLLLNDGGTGTADTFELPNPSPKTFPLGSYPYALAVNELDHHWFVADPVDNTASEYDYPSGKLIGTIRGGPGAAFGTGIAVDP